MGSGTRIEWADEVWNPASGCTRVSDGCRNCYIERQTPMRVAGRRFLPVMEGGDPHAIGARLDIQLHHNRLDQPLRWKRPRRIFVNSMSDLFHDEVPDDYIARVFAAAALAKRHTFQILTKRHARMRSLLSGAGWRRMCEDAYDQMNFDAFTNGAIRRPTFEQNRGKWWSDFAEPLPNVWLGVSVENQQLADRRIPALLDTPAALRFISAEPLLERVDLERWLHPHGPTCDCRGCFNIVYRDRPQPLWWGQQHPLAWVICGGESGRRDDPIRPMHPEWARQLRDQCQGARVPFFFKQWGEWSPNHRNVQLSARRWQYESTRFAPDGTVYEPTKPALWNYPGMESMVRVGKRLAGNELDGKVWEEFPDA